MYNKPRVNENSTKENIGTPEPQLGSQIRKFLTPKSRFYRIILVGGYEWRRWSGVD